MLLQCWQLYFQEMKQGQQLCSDRSIIKQMAIPFLFHFQTQVDLYSFKVSPYDPVPIFWAMQGPRNPLILFFPFIFQSSAYWQKQMKRMNIHSMNDEEAGSPSQEFPRALLHGGLSLQAWARHRATRGALLPTNWLTCPCSSLATILQVKNLQDSRVCWIN